MTTITVARGNPTAEELAAVLVVLHARAASAPGAGTTSTDAEPAALDVWADKGRAAKPWPGPHVWRTTYWPR
jgi:hypothetical protein